MSASHDTPTTHFVNPKDCSHQFRAGFCDLCGTVQPDRTPEPTPAEIAEYKRRQAAIDVDTPGFYAQYDGKVDVYAEDEEQAKERALRELKRGAFPDRSAAMWKIEKVERLN